MHKPQLWGCATAERWHTGQVLANLIGCMSSRCQENAHCTDSKQRNRPAEHVLRSCWSISVHHMDKSRQLGCARVWAALETALIWGLGPVIAREGCGHREDNNDSDSHRKRILHLCKTFKQICFMTAVASCPHSIVLKLGYT